jgi:hypothetical protein
MGFPCPKEKKNSHAKTWLAIKKEKLPGTRRESFSLDHRISCRRLYLQKMKRMSRKYRKNGGKKSGSCILRMESGGPY